MAKYDVIITVKGRNPFIGETTNSLKQARKRFNFEKGLNDGRIVDIIQNETTGNSFLLESTHLRGGE